MANMYLCICETCKEEFFGVFQRGKFQRYCSKECYKIGCRGKGNPLYGKHSWNLGKPHSPKTRQRISIAISGEKGPRWNGGCARAKAGYIFIRSPKHPYKDNRGYMLEHRLVVEKLIGHYLLRSEPVHHRGKKDDNRPRMLMAFKNNLAHKTFEAGHKVNPSDIIFDGRKFP